MKCETVKLQVDSSTALSEVMISYEMTAGFCFSFLFLYLKPLVLYKLDDGILDYYFLIGWGNFYFFNSAQIMLTGMGQYLKKSSITGTGGKRYEYKNITWFRCVHL